MIKKIALMALMGASISLSSLEAQNGSKPIKLEDIISGQFYARGAGYGIRSTRDGAHYTQIAPQGDALLRYSFATGKLVDTLFSTSNARNCSFTSFSDYDISSDGNHILLYTETEPIYRRSSKSKVYHYDVRRRYVEPLSEVEGKVMVPTFSPDGRMVAFVRQGNIFIKKFDFNTEVQVTTDGRATEIINGTTDWVYEEELETTKLMSWSEDSQALAYVRTDERAVPQYDMQLFQGKLYPTNYTYKYPKAGETNAKVSAHVYYLDGRHTKVVPIPAEDAYYIPRIEFIGRNGNLAIMTLNRHQNHFRLYYTNYKSLLPKLIYDERSQTYVDSQHLQTLSFTDKGFVLVSERDGYAHLYQYTDQGTLQRQMTKGSWDVMAFYGMDSKGVAYFQAATTSPTQYNIYKLDAKGAMKALMPEGGMNRAIFSEDFQYFIGTHSSLNSPSTTSVYLTSQPAKTLRTLEDNASLKARLAEYRFAPKEFFTLKTKSGHSLNGWMVKPADFDPSKRYPVMMTQYSGPNSQQVLDSYSFHWEYYLASQGIIVVCVDGRGTGARGEAWRKGTYLKLGQQESQDQIEAAQALAEYPYIDGKRIAIWGWSFGGYNTLMSLCHGAGTFKLGIAVAPVTDWKYYDTIYTERFMRTPAENPSGYKAGSVLEAAHQLQGKLLLIHGTADDNVHVQNSYDLTERLVQANIPFDMAIYTDKDHSIRGGRTSIHLYSKMSRYLIDNL